jgi:hypothetical protein
MLNNNTISTVETPKPQATHVSYTNSVSSRQSLRRNDAFLTLQKNCAFERSLWEEDGRLNYSPLAPRRTAIAHLLPVEASARSILLKNAMHGQKLFIFNLVDLVEGLENSAEVLDIEQAQVKVLEANFTQYFNSVVKSLAFNLYGAPSVESEQMLNAPLKTFLSGVLLRVYLLLLCGEISQAERLLHKVKLVLPLSVTSSQKLLSSQGVTLLNNLSRKYAEEIFAGTLPSRNHSVLRFVHSRMFGRVISAPVAIKQLIWKRATLASDQEAALRRFQRGNYFSAHRLSSRENSLSFVYFLRRLEEKHAHLSVVDPKAAESLLNARNYLLILAEERLHRRRQNTLLLVRPNWARVIRRRLWRSLLVEALIRRAEQTSEGRMAVESLSPLIASLVSRNSLPAERRRATTIDSADNVTSVVPANLSWQRNSVTSHYPLLGTKLAPVEGPVSVHGYTDVLSRMTGREVSLFFVNALSLTRFAFQGEGKGKSSQRFLQNIDREMVSRYKYVAVYIQDFVRVSFISLFLKKPTFLAQFMALQISKLPRNRKETKMLRFLIKVVKIFAAQRREVVGLRILFKGRVNRWRRTKQIVGEKGILPLQSLSSRIEFGFAKAVTRKGTLGIRVWICYNPVFRRELRNAFLDYFEYSQQLRRRSLHRFLAEFQPR